MQVTTHTTIYRPFLTEENPKNVKLVETQTTWHGGVIQGHKKLFKIQKMFGEFQKMFALSKFVRNFKKKSCFQILSNTNNVLENYKDWFQFFEIPIFLVFSKKYLKN